MIVTNSSGMADVEEKFKEMFKPEPALSALMRKGVPNTARDQDLTKVIIRLGDPSLEKSEMHEVHNWVLIVLQPTDLNRSAHDDFCLGKLVFEKISTPHPPSV